MGIIWSDINLNHSTILQSDGYALEFAYLCTKLFSWMLCMPWFFAVVVLQAVFLLLIQTPTNIKKNAWIDINACFPLVKACEKVVFSPMIIRRIPLWFSANGYCGCFGCDMNAYFSFIFTLLPSGYILEHFLNLSYADLKQSGFLSLN